MRSWLACTILLFLSPSMGLPLTMARGTSELSGQGSASGGAFNNISRGASGRVAAHSRQGVDADELKDVLRDLIRASRQSFQELRASAGRRVGDNVVYPSSLAVPSASETSIWMPTGAARAYVIAKVYVGDDPGRAGKIYSDFVAKLKSAFPSGTGTDASGSDASPTGRLHFFEPNFDDIDAAIVVSFKCSNSSSGCSVTLTVRAPEGAVKPKVVEEEIREKPPKRVDVKVAALEVIDKLVATDYEGVRADFNNQMKASASVETLGQIWTSIVQSLGSYQGHDEPRTKQVQSLTVVMVKCRMERGAVDLHVAYDEGGKIGGIWAYPPEGAAPKRSAQELEKLKQTAQDCLAKLIARNFENVGSNFNQQAKFTLPPQRLMEVWALILQQYGAVRSQEPPDLASKYGYDIVVIKCNMERGSMAVDVTFDDEGKISGLWLHPVL